jgi:hypothetical protein
MLWQDKPELDATNVLLQLQKMLATGMPLTGAFGAFGADQTTSAALRVAMLDPEIPLAERQELEHKLLEEELKKDADAQVGIGAGLLYTELGHLVCIRNRCRQCGRCPNVVVDDDGDE